MTVFLHTVLLANSTLLINGTKDKTKESTMKKILSLSTFIVSLLLMSTPSQAMPKAGTVFKDWVVSCQTIPKTKKQHCHIAQTASDRKTNKPVLHTMIGRIVGQTTPVVIFIIPKLISPKTKLQLVFGPKLAVNFKVTSCDKKTKTCSAGLPLDKKIQKAFKKGKVAFFAYKQGKKVVKIPISLMGITSGLNSLPKK